MDHPTRIKSLRIALVVLGLVFVVGFYPLTVVWPSGWTWHEGRSEYLEMMIALYATLGIVLLLASRQPEQHLGLIAFTIWSSIVHATVMAIQALRDPMHVAHLLGDVPALYLAALILGWLCPPAFKLQLQRPGPAPADDGSVRP